MSWPTETAASGHGFAAGTGRRMHGFSLVELVVFIAIISVGLAGILGVMNFTTRASADPLAQKQALAIAEAYLEEVLAMPFTYCDPDDANAATAQSVSGCATLVEGLGPESGELRGSGTNPYDNVNDYNGLAGVPANSDGTAIGGLGAYQVAVAVAPANLVANTATVPAGTSLRVTVTVTGPNGVTAVLDGYRTRYAPNALP
ncbi:MAG: type II secretion system protein [Burkholderiales bacterium]|nr:type II secretion system protein [Burkholderiales bacterium]